MRRRILVGVLLFFALLVVSAHATGVGTAGVNLCSLRPSSVDGEIAISNPSIRLPVSNTTNVEFKLTATNGCFKWNSSNPSLVTVTPVDSNIEKGCDEEAEESKCTKEALVNVVTAEKDNSCWINAEETVSHRLLRTEVFLAEIVRIEILTTTRKIYRDDLEFLMLQGFDAQGSVFNTLEGFKFKWTIEFNGTKEGGSKVLEFVKFKDSSFEGPSPLLLSMEEKGDQSYAVLVKGLDIGNAIVTATLIEPGHKRIAPANVTLSVREKLRLKPTEPIYVLLGTTVIYELLKSNRDHQEVAVELPHPHYTWTSENSKVASIDQRGVATALQLGVSKISVQHIKMDENHNSATLHVVNPAFLGLRLSDPQGKTLYTGSTSIWYLVTGHAYTMSVEVYDSQSHAIYITKDLQFEITLSEEFLTSVERSSNNDRLQVQTQRQGVTYVTASLVASAKHTLEHPITIKQQVVISLPLRIGRPPNVVVLPHGIHGGQRHQHTLIAVGGSGEYSWHAADRDSIVSVNGAGVLTVQDLGSTRVSVVDRRCPYNKDSISVVVVLPASIVFDAQTVEVEVGSQLRLVVAMKDEQGRYFQNCSTLAVEWSIGDNTVFTAGTSERDNLIGGNCSSRYFMALKEGYSVIRASYGPNLKAEITIYAFSPIRVISPSDGPALVTLGSSATVIFEGGPNPWFQDPTGYFESLEATVEAQPMTGGVPQFDAKDNILIIKLGQHPLASTHGGTRHSYQVTCLRHSETVLTITVGNRPTGTNPFPAAAKSTTTFVCKPPQIFLLFPKRQTPHPLSSDTGYITSCDTGAFPTLEMVKEAGAALPTRYRVSNGKTIEIMAAVLDDQRRLFHNFSSLQIDWSVSDSGRASFATVESQDQSIADRALQRLKLSTKQGPVVVGATIAGFQPKYLKQVRFEGTRQTFRALTKELEFILLDDVKLTPEYVRIFNSRRNSVRLQAIAGSGYFKFSSNTSEAVSIYHDEGSRFVDVVPSAEGTVQISAIDICLEGSTPATAIVRILEVTRVTLRARDMIRIGDTVPLEVDVFDSNGEPFEPSQLHFIEFTQSTSSDVVEIQSKKENRYFLRGVSLGTSTITFTMRRFDDTLIRSEPLVVHVFPVFSIQPKQLILLPDCSFQVQWVGGPPLRAEVSFRSEDLSVASVTPLGLVKGVGLGRTRLHAEITSTESPTGDKIVFGSDSIEVIVRQLSEIRVFYHTTKILVGEEVVLRVEGGQGETPFTYASGAPIRFRWDVVNTEVVSLAPIYENGNVSLDLEAGFSVRVQGKSAGRSRISVQVLSASPRLLAGSIDQLQAKIEIQVIQPLKVLFPFDDCQRRLLLLPSSRAQIKTNKDHTNKLRYQAISSGGGDIISVDQRGTILTKNLHGVTLILISDHEESLQLPSVVVQVAIKPPQVLELLPISGHHAIPIGQTLQLQLRLGDDQGSVFDSYDGITFGYQLNTADTVSIRIDIASRSVFVTALRPGDTILKVFVVGFEYIEDFVQLKVDSAILPALPVVHIGGTLRFSLQVKDIRDVGAHLWQTSDSDVLSIDPFTGVAEALRLGAVAVQNNITSFASTQVAIVRVNAIDVDTHLAPVSNVIDRVLGAPKEYRFPITFFGNDRPLRFKAHQIDHSIIYQCTVEETEYAIARAEKEPDTGEDYCVITPKVASELATKPYRWPNSLTLVITAGDRTSSYSFEHRQSIAYQPAFFISSLLTPHITLTSDRRSFSFTVHHNKPNTITGSTGDPSRLHLSQVSKERDSIVFEIRTQQERQEFDNIAVEIFSLETHQRELFYVSYRREEYVPEQPTKFGTGATTEHNGDSRLSNLTINIILIGLVTIFVWVVAQQFNTPAYDPLRVNPNPNPNPPTSPSHLQTSVNSFSSPPWSSPRSNSRIRPY